MTIAAARETLNAVDHGSLARPLSCATACLACNSRLIQRLASIAIRKSGKVQRPCSNFTKRPIFNGSIVRKIDPDRSMHLTSESSFRFLDKPSTVSNPCFAISSLLDRAHVPGPRNSQLQRHGPN